MATTTSSTNPPPPPPPLGITSEALNRVDLNQLSQSDLQTLSLSSTSYFDVRCNSTAPSSTNPPTDLLTPPPPDHSRLPGYHPSLKPHHNTNPTSDPVTHSIVHFLEHFLDGNHNPPPPPPPYSAAPEAPGALGLKGNLKIKRKRGREGTLMENGAGMEMGRGEVVDVEELGRTGDELFVEELRGRTEGLETEEGVMGLLWGLEGQWCSRRKRRKYVDTGCLEMCCRWGGSCCLGSEDGIFAPRLLLEICRWFDVVVVAAFVR